MRPPTAQPSGAALARASALRPALLGAIGAAMLACNGSLGPLGGPAPVPLRLELERRPPAAGAESEPGPVLAALETELERSFGVLSQQKDPAPYFLAYQVTDRRSVQIAAAFGGLLASEDSRTRTLDVDVRVGSYDFDNTRPARGSDLMMRSGLGHPSWQIPLDDDPVVLRRALWLGSNAEYRRAVEEFAKVRTNALVRASDPAQGESPADFARAEPVVQMEPVSEVEIDRALWEARVRDYSTLLRADPAIYDGRVVLQVSSVTRYIANTEGSRVRTPRTHARLSVYAITRSSDGMDLSRFESVELDPTAPPDDAVALRAVRTVIEDLRALRQAPRAEPYVGPAILEGTAAGVFAHEVLGHRVEGHRQKSDDEGQTFAAKVGERVMPAFIDIYDDPTIWSLNDTLLNGYYTVDDEAVRPRRAAIVESGVLRGFLMSRSPVQGFDRSTGHGRRQEGFDVVARQGNLIVHPSRVVPKAELRRMLLDEIRRQGKPYGLRFAVVEGGYTNTSRVGIQAFRVSPVMVYKVFPDGSEQLIRGASIDGTPLSSLSQILAAGDDVQVFNGYCGAESGSVPVAAVSPSLLLGRVEISGVFSMRSRQPVLPPPPAGLPPETATAPDATSPTSPPEVAR